MLGVDGYVSRRQNGTTGYFFRDAHGDVVAALDQSKKVIAHYTYDAWGDAKTTGTQVWGASNPIRYNGQYYDTESGMTYLRARYYDSGVRRFISEDPHWNVDNMLYGDSNSNVPDISAIIQSSNLYGYAMNNPVMFIDPRGMVAYEHFDSLDKAVKDWVWTNYSTSYYLELEIASIIYQAKDENGNLYYSHTKFLVGNEHDVTIPEGLRGDGTIPYNSTEIAVIHSHVNSNESFSENDKNYLKYNSYNVKTIYVAYGSPYDITIDQCEYDPIYNESYSSTVATGKYTVGLSEQTKRKLKRKWL